MDSKNLIGAAMAALASLSVAQQAIAMPMAGSGDLMVQGADNYVSTVAAACAKGRCAHGGGARGHTNVNRSMNHSVNRNVNANVNVNRNVNRNVHVNAPYHGGIYRGGVYGGAWHGGPWVRSYGWPVGGAIAAGAAIGFVVAATATWAPPPPQPGLCWYYTDSTQRQGFWDNCP